MSNDSSPKTGNQIRALREQRRDLLRDSRPDYACPRCQSVIFEVEAQCLACSTSRPADGWQSLSALNDPWLGSVVADRYFVAQPLGHGTSGDVYRGESLSISRQFAVKIISTDKDPSQAEQIATRLNREIEALSRLKNPHIVSFYEIFDLDGGFVAAVMDMIEGTTLESLVLDDGGPLAIARACALLRQTANGIYEAHQADMIHRDLKPENLMVEQLPAGDDFVHILDFGIVRLTDDTRVDLTQGFIGTPLYASPEQAMGKDCVDHRSDIYSLGAILFFMLTGRPPFDSQNVYKVLRQHVRKPPPRLGEVCDREFPGALEDLVGRMLAKRPDDRPRDLSQVIDELDQLDHGRAPESSPKLDSLRSSGPHRSLSRDQQPTPGSGIIEVPDNINAPDSSEASATSESNEFVDNSPTSSATIQAYGERQRNETPAFGRNHTPSGGSYPTDPEISFHGTGNTNSAATAISSATHQLSSPASRIEAAYRTDGSFTIYEHGDRELQLFAPDASTPVAISVDAIDHPEALTLSGSNLLVGDRCGTISRINPTGPTVTTLYQDVRRTPISAIATDDNETCIVAGSASGKIYMHHRNRTGSSDWERLRDGQPVRSLALNNSADTVAIARRDNTVELIGVSNPRVPTGQFRVDAPVRSMAISPDDYLLAAALVDRSVALFQLPTGNKIMSFQAEDLDVLAIHFSADAEPVTICSVQRQLRVLKFEQIGSPTSG